MSMAGRRAEVLPFDVEGVTFYDATVRSTRFRDRLTLIIANDNRGNQTWEYWSANGEKYWMRWPGHSQEDHCVSMQYKMITREEALALTTDVPAELRVAEGL